MGITHSTSKFDTQYDRLVKRYDHENCARIFLISPLISTGDTMFCGVRRRRILKTLANTLGLKEVLKNSSFTVKISTVQIPGRCTFVL